MDRYEITKDDHQLIQKGLEVQEKNFDDGIYNHTVGCAIRCTNGNVYTGVNCDGMDSDTVAYEGPGLPSVRNR